MRGLTAEVVRASTTLPLLTQKNPRRTQPKSSTKTTTKPKWQRRERQQNPSTITTITINPSTTTTTITAITDQQQQQQQLYTRFTAAAPSTAIAATAPLFGNGSASIHEELQQKKQEKLQQ